MGQFRGKLASSDSSPDERFYMQRAMEIFHFDETINEDSYDICKSNVYRKFPVKNFPQEFK